MRAVSALCFAVLLAAPLTADDTDQRDQRFADYLSGVRFVGHFTVTGQPSADLKTEEYVIDKVEKLPEKDRFRFTASIQYGDGEKVNKVPMDLQVLWAGRTPVITLDEVWLPGLGTFSARVVIHDDKYAGTWQHGDKGGHLFGDIEPLEQTETTEGAPRN